MNQKTLEGEVVRSEAIKDNSSGSEVYLACLDTTARLSLPRIIHTNSSEHLVCYEMGRQYEGGLELCLKNPIYWIF